MQSTIILCGSDPSLLMTRQMLLERQGLRVTTLLGISLLDEAAGEVLVLCYTLTRRDQMIAVERYRSRFPQGKVLLLGRDRPEVSCPECQTLPAYCGPRSFVEKVGSLVA